jgi:Predicted bile acid beta-glucosidase
MLSLKNKRFHYTGENTKFIAFPLGGIGAGMFCMEGSGMLSHFSLRHRPDLQSEPGMFAALTVKKADGLVSRVLEGPIEKFKIFGGASRDLQGFGTGCSGKNYGLPRFASRSFSAGFPFCYVNPEDSEVPLKAEIMGWSPFVPNNADESGLPAAGLEYSFENPTNETVEGVFYFCSPNFITNEWNNAQAAISKTHALKNGFQFAQSSTPERFYDEGYFRVTADEDAYVDCDWFRGWWFDALTMQWNRILEGGHVSQESGDKRSSGASLAIPFALKPGEKKTVRLYITWYVPFSNLRCHEDPEGYRKEWNKSDPKNYYRPWYAKRFSGIDEVSAFWCKHYDALKKKSTEYHNELFSLDLPEAVLDSVTANLSILKSPTILRQWDGRLWGWEGCEDSRGSCHGSCTHVWNYAQAICHLFPDLERSLRETEFFVSQNEIGFQMFRTPLPIRTGTHLYFAASDGQLGGIIKAYRDWKICGDDTWLKKLWPKIKDSLEYGIRTWDPDEQGVLTEPHHNTYDIEFWGADAMCTSFYLGALKAASLMAAHLGEKDTEKRYAALYKKGVHYVETELYNGEFFYQKVMWKNLRAKLDTSEQSEAAQALAEKEGPKYQYGTGCLSDGILGAWLSKLAGLGDIFDKDKISSHLLSIYKYNLKKTLQGHSNPQRPGFAIGDEGGLLLCSWPLGSKPSIPFVYSDEVWTGIEHQVASHLALMGYKQEAEEIETVCRKRYDGTVRNPFSEYECGNWYARAMSSYALIESFKK